MDALILVLQVASLLAVLVVGWLVKSYMPSYFSEKGKNLATMEDIEEITRKIEQVKASLGLRLRRVRCPITCDRKRHRRRPVPTAGISINFGGNGLLRGNQITNLTNACCIDPDNN